MHPICQDVGRYFLVLITKNNSDCNLLVSAIGLVTEDHTVLRSNVICGQRPSLNAVTGPETLVKVIRDCIRSCWDQCPERRPAFCGRYCLCLFSDNNCILWSLLPASKLKLHIVKDK